jgi:hypothetical protein
MLTCATYASRCHLSILSLGDVQKIEDEVRVAINRKD